MLIWVTTRNIQPPGLQKSKSTTILTRPPPSLMPMGYHLVSGLLMWFLHGMMMCPMRDLASTSPKHTKKSLKLDSQNLKTKKKRRKKKTMATKQEKAVKLRKKRLKSLSIPPLLVLSISLLNPRKMNGHPRKNIIMKLLTDISESTRTWEASSTKLKLVHSWSSSMSLPVTNGKMRPNITSTPAHVPSRIQPRNVIHLCSWWARLSANTWPVCSSENGEEALKSDSFWTTPRTPSSTTDACESEPI